MNLLLENSSLIYLRNVFTKLYYIFCGVSLNFNSVNLMNAFRKQYPNAVVSTSLNCRLESTLHFPIPSRDWNLDFSCCSDLHVCMNEYVLYISAWLSAPLVNRDLRCCSRVDLVKVVLNYCRYLVDLIFISYWSLDAPGRGRSEGCDRIHLIDMCHQGIYVENIVLWVWSKYGFRSVLLSQHCTWTAVRAD